MKQIQLFITLVIGQLLFSAPIKAADIPDSTTVSKQHYYAAKEQFKDMLSGKEELSYEKAITIVENAYYENQVNLVDFNLLIDFHVQNINRIIEINYDESAMEIERILHKTEEQQKEEYRNALINWAIYSYITDTTLFLVNNQLFYHLPYEYSYEDPLGTVNWQTTQVFNLLDNKTGNCYALASLFKIFSERLNSEAFICTAPGHIYIRHADHKGIYYNVELGSKAFPGTGSLETLTYTTDEATKNGISLRELDLKQSVALNLVYLAKGYAYKFGVKDDNFIMECAELALQYDELNLNAMLLKAEVLEERLIKKDKTIKALQSDKTFQEYEKLITHLFDLGYREMPTEMKDLVISRLRKEDSPYPMTNHTPKPFEDLGVKEERYATLSGGLFDEQMLTKPIEQYHRTMFDTKQKKIIELVELDTTYNNYPVDLVVFAWNIDPMDHVYPSISPYTFVANNPISYVDPDGNVITYAKGSKAESVFLKIYNNGSDDTKAALDKLQASDVVYNIVVNEYSGTSPGGTTTYDFNTGGINITVDDFGDQTVEILGDELAHAHQFEVGEIGFYKQDGQTIVSGYDINDELRSKEAAVAAAKTNNVPLISGGSGESYDINVNQKGQDPQKWLKGFKNENGSYKELFKQLGQNGLKGDIPGSSYGGYGSAYTLSQAFWAGIIQQFAYRRGSSQNSDGSINYETINENTGTTEVK